MWRHTETRRQHHLGGRSSVRPRCLRQPMEKIRFHLVWNILQVSPSAPVPVSGRVSGESFSVTGEDRGHFSKDLCEHYGWPVRTWVISERSYGWPDRTGVNSVRVYRWLGRTGPVSFWDRFPIFKKIQTWTIVPIFFFPSLWANGKGKGMSKTETWSEESEEVLQVEIKGSFLPITPTYDQYVQWWVGIPESEGFHVFSRSVMIELLEPSKCMVLHDKQNKCVLFKIRVDVWRRSNNLSEDRSKRAGLGVSRCDRLTYTLRLCKYVWSDVTTTEHQHHQWLHTRRARWQQI